MDWVLAVEIGTELENGIILDVPNRRQLSFWRSSQSQLLTAAQGSQRKEDDLSLLTSHSHHHHLESLE